VEVAVAEGHAGGIASPEDFKGFYHDTMGTSSCCPIVLKGMHILQHRYDLTDPELVDRCNRDLGFKSFRVRLSAAFRRPPS
jgi:hypothetical protein